MKPPQQSFLRSIKSVLFFHGAAGLVLLAPLSPCLAKEPPSKAVALGVEAYIYGYPLVTMEYTRRSLTNVETSEGFRAPVGQLTRGGNHPVNHLIAPVNADTLHTTGFIDVEKEPWVISLPNLQERYYLFLMLDAWSNVFASPGKRTTGTGPQKYAITGPGWKGSLPEGVREYKSSTNLVWIIGHIYCSGTPTDCVIVRRLQEQISLVPLSAYGSGKPYTPPPSVIDPQIDMKTAIPDQVNALSADEYFNLLSKLMKDNPPTPADAPMLKKMAEIGIVPGKYFHSANLGPEAKEAFSLVPRIANEKIMLWIKEGVVAGDNHFKNGWFYTTKTGTYGTNYIQRAMMTTLGLGANLPQDAINPTSEGPSMLKPYTGEKRYVMHFKKGELPPVNAFWSLTMYDPEYEFVPNPINRQCIGSRQDLRPNEDGSVDLYIQNETPGLERQSNWLPAPKGKFILVMRLFWPKEGPPSILDGSWKIPPVKEVE